MREVRRSHVEPRVSRGYLLKPYYCLYSHPLDILEQLFGSTTIFPEVASIRFQHQQLLEFKWCQPTRLLPFLIFNRAITRYSQPLLDRVPDMR